MSWPSKQTLKAFIPPILLPWVRQVTGVGNRFVGPYATWDDAARTCAGYDQANILQKVRDATLCVLRGEAAYERDSVVFTEPDYAWPLLAMLTWIAAQSKDGLHVLDFGGALGSTYLQNRQFLSELKELSWHVVEQPAFVLCGQQDVILDNLHFFVSLADAAACRQPNILLLSSVLQYLSDPWSLLDQALALNAEFVLIDRTAFDRDDRDTIRVQQVDSSIYEASYPCRFFSETALTHYFIGRGFVMVTSFPSLDQSTRAGYWKGFLFRRKSHE